MTVDLYLPSLGDVHERLVAGGRIADIACGEGRAGIATAIAYPKSFVVGLDPDDGAIFRARGLAAESDVCDRTTFEVHDCVGPLPHGPFDLVMIEALEHLPHPIEVLARARESLAPGGIVTLRSASNEEEEEA